MPTKGVGDMTDSEVMEFIANAKVGVLTLVDGDRPYAVPVEHYFDGKSLYVIVSSREEQRKLAAMQQNSNAAFVIYESRREQPELAKRGIRCRSVLIEGKVRVDGIRESTGKTGTFKVKRLKLDIEKIGNWQCPAKTCDWKTSWYESYPDLVADVAKPSS